MVLYAVIIAMFLFYLFIPLYIHKVSCDDHLDIYANMIIKMSVISQAVFIFCMIWTGGPVALSKHLALQYGVSVVVILIVSIITNGVVITYLTDRYIPKMKLNMSVYEYLTRYELLWIMALMAFFYYIVLWFFYNQFNPYIM